MAASSAQETAISGLDRVLRITFVPPYAKHVSPLPKRATVGKPGDQTLLTNKVIMKQKEQERVIDLDRSRNSRAFHDEEDLWIKDRERVLQLLRKHLDLLEAQPDRERDNEPARGKSEATSHDAPMLSIAIFGPSGSGKTSFLHSLVEALNNSNPGSSELRERYRKRVFSLPLINPTRFSENDDFLYAFLAAALEETETRESRGKRGTKYETEQHFESLSEIQRQFNEVAQHLQVIDKAPTVDDYDPLGMSLARLDRHTSGRRLRNGFRGLIDALARELTTGRDSIIILPVDDADMAVERLVPTLRSYRTYLLHPQLVPVFTFTDRMAEEILRVNYHSNIFGDAKIEEDERALGPSDRLDVTRQLGLQFLANCFPVRNRIRLGSAPAFVQEAKYKVRKTVHGDEDAKASRTVEGWMLPLLTTASFLLYGHPDRDTAHSVRSALRPSTLRRQLQVADSMLEADIDSFVEEQFIEMAGDPPGLAPRGEGSSPQVDEAWVSYFSKAAWSLFNVHRDILRELNLHLEDLYSWTRLQLRRVVLNTILGQSREHRQALLQSWRSRADERRGQVLSLLAAEVFRPWMQSEDPPGDVQRPVSGNEQSDRDKYEISVAKGIVWFLNLAIGFYQPQVLARNRESDRRLTGIGWDLRYGPINAIRAADSNLEIFSTGKMFLDPVKLSKVIDEVENTSEESEVRKEASRNELLLRLWSSYGYRQGRFWAAVSLWRGLGLIGRLLEATDAWSGSSKGLEKKWKRRFLAKVGYFKRRLVKGSLAVRLERCEEKLNLPEPELGTTAGSTEDRREGGEETEENVQRLEDDLERLEEDIDRVITAGNSGEKLIQFDREKEIQGLIRTHSISGLVPRSFLGQQEADNRLYVGFRTWDTKEQKEEIRKLAVDVRKWLELFKDQKVRVMPGENERIYWRRSFTRRIHGEYIIGDLMPRLNLGWIESLRKDELFWIETTKEYTGFRSNAWIALERWTRVLLVYWEGCHEIFECFKECPILKPFRKLKGDEKLRPILESKYGSLLEVLGDATKDGAGSLMELRKYISWMDEEKLRMVRLKADTDESNEVKRLSGLIENLSDLVLEFQGVEAIFTNGKTGGAFVAAQQRFNSSREELEKARAGVKAAEKKLEAAREKKDSDAADAAKKELGRSDVILGEMEQQNAKARAELDEAEEKIVEKTARFRRAIQIRLFCEISRVLWKDFEVFSRPTESQIAASRSGSQPVGLAARRHRGRQETAATPEAATPEAREDDDAQ